MMSSDKSSDGDPNFAVILEFLSRFSQDLFGDGWKLRIASLEEALESPSVSPYFSELLIKLLRKLRKPISGDKWEKSLVRFLLHSEEGAALAACGEKGFVALTPKWKTKILRLLCESQFELNLKFRLAVTNEKDKTKLRSGPIGQDHRGNLYWYFEDEEGSLRIYKEDLDEETWELVAKDKQSFTALIVKLKDHGRVGKETSPPNLDDEASLQDGLENLIRDTRPAPNSIEHSNATSVANSDLEEENVSPTCPSSPVDGGEKKSLEGELTKEGLSPIKEEESGDELPIKKRRSTVESERRLFSSTQAETEMTPKTEPLKATSSQEVMEDVPMEEKVEPMDTSEKDMTKEEEGKHTLSEKKDPTKELSTSDPVVATSPVKKEASSYLIENAISKLHESTTTEDKPQKTNEGNNHDKIHPSDLSSKSNVVEKMLDNDKMVLKEEHGNNKRLENIRNASREKSPLEESKNQEGTKSKLQTTTNESANKMENAIGNQDDAKATSSSKLKTDSQKSELLETVYSDIGTKKVNTQSSADSRKDKSIDMKSTSSPFDSLKSNASSDKSLATVPMDIKNVTSDVNLKEKSPEKDSVSTPKESNEHSKSDPTSDKSVKPILVDDPLERGTSYGRDLTSSLYNLKDIEGSKLKALSDTSVNVASVNDLSSKNKPSHEEAASQNDSKNTEIPNLDESKSTVPLDLRPKEKSPESESASLHKDSKTTETIKSCKSNYTDSADGHRPKEKSPDKVSVSLNKDSNNKETLKSINLITTVSVDLNSKDKVLDKKSTSLHKDTKNTEVIMSEKSNKTDDLGPKEKSPPKESASPPKDSKNTDITKSEKSNETSYLRPKEKSPENESVSPKDSKNTDTTKSEKSNETNDLRPKEKSPKKELASPQQDSKSTEASKSVNLMTTHSVDALRSKEKSPVKESVSPHQDSKNVETPKLSSQSSKSDATVSVDKTNVVSEVIFKDKSVEQKCSTSSENSNKNDILGSKPQLDKTTVTTQEDESTAVSNKNADQNSRNVVANESIAKVDSDEKPSSVEAQMITEPSVVNPQSKSSESNSKDSFQSGSPNQQSTPDNDKSLSVVETKTVSSGSSAVKQASTPSVSSSFSKASETLSSVSEVNTAKADSGTPPKGIPEKAKSELKGPIAAPSPDGSSVDSSTRTPVPNISVPQVVVKPSSSVSKCSSFDIVSVLGKASPPKSSKLPSEIVTPEEVTPSKKNVLDYPLESLKVPEEAKENPASSASVKEVPPSSSKEEKYISLGKNPKEESNDDSAKKFPNISSNLSTNKPSSDGDSSLDTRVDTSNTKVLEPDSRSRDSLEGNDIKEASLKAMPLKKRCLTPTEPLETLPAAKRPKVGSSPIVGEAVEEPVVVISGEGQGALTEAKNNGAVNGKEVEDEEEDNNNAESNKKKKKKTEEDPPLPLRQSRRSSGRIASLRIKEAERRQREEEEALLEFKAHQKKKKQKEALKFEGGKKKKQQKDSDYEEELHEDEDSRQGGGGGKQKKRKKKKKKKRGEQNLKEFEKYSSGSDSEDENGEDEFEEDYCVEERIAPPEEDDLFKSDHEFSCESDVPEEEVTPIKHARTLVKKRKAPVKVEESESEEDDFACKKCGKGDHPEWILLCDTEGCEVGWHASCLRPSLMVIPEGAWHCPDCQHATLIQKLEARFSTYEVVVKKREADEKRKERLAFVSLSLSKVIPTKDPASRRKPPKSPSSSGGDSSSGSSGEENSSSEGSSSSSEDEAPIQRRRAARNVNYNMKEYDDMIKSALRDEDQKKKPGTSAAAIAAGKEPRSNYEEEEEEEEEEGGELKEDDRPGVGKGKDMSNILGVAKQDAPSTGPQPIQMEINKDLNTGKMRKKKKKLSDLAASSEDDGDSGSDFQLSASDPEDPDEDFEAPSESEDSEEMLYNQKKAKGNATRRSNRNRKVLYDDDFIFDGSLSDDDEGQKGGAKAKKAASKGKRGRWEDSWTETEESDEDYGRQKKSKKASRKGGVAARKKKKEDSSGDEEESFDSRAQKYREKIINSKRRTRGKKISFQETLSGSSSEGGSSVEGGKAPKTVQKKASPRVSEEEEEEDDDEFDENKLVVDESKSEDEDENGDESESDS